MNYLQLIPWKWVGAALALLALFLYGVMIGSRHTQGRWDKEREQIAAQHLAQIEADAAAVNRQIQVTHDIEAKYAALQTANTAANDRLHSLLRQYAARASAVPSAPQGPASPADAPVEPESLDGFTGVVGRLSDACRDDAAKLASLQAWVHDSGLD